MGEIETIFVESTDSIREVMECIERGAKGISLLVDADRRCCATITDGDVRRSILSGLPLDAPVSQLLVNGKRSQHLQPVSAPAGISREEMIDVMRREKVRHLPLLDPQGRVVDLAVLGDLLPDGRLPVQAVIMAGGFGKRLKPLTDDTPKPMLPIDGRPLMERTIERLRDAGIQSINITTHFMREKITDHFGDGMDFGVKLRYVSEEQPLGTAGSLGLVDTGEEPLLVVNGDILTHVDFRALVAFHRDQQAHLTLAVRQYDMEVPYGVVEAENGKVMGVREKPKLNFLVNAGIYLLEPSMRRFIPHDQRFDMTELIAKLIAEGIHVACFPVVEYWIDIGQPDDFQRAQEDMRKLMPAA